MTERNWRVAVVGAGPSGLYGVDALVKRGASVDVFERQFAPFGLVRYGVAPDHQKIKKTQAVFERILNQPAVRFFGNVKVGEDISLEELKKHYDQILIAMGSSGARGLGIPGEHLSGSWSATELVNWYNGHPEFVDLAPDLSSERAVVVGVGNVAIDVARVLLRNPEELAPTDIPQHALSALKMSQIREVLLLARRGPDQSAFDEKEVRELAALEGISVEVDGPFAEKKTHRSEFIAALPRIRELSEGKRVVLRFCASPVELLGSGSLAPGRVEKVRVEENVLVEEGDRVRAVGTGKFEILDAGLVVRAVGYQGEGLKGVPFSEETGTIPHQDGRVLSEPGGDRIAGLYVTGWIKRGPTGLIGTNKSCAVETVEAMEADLDQVRPERDPGEVLTLLGERGIRFISAEDWKLLDAHELESGRTQGKVRVKLLSTDEAFQVLGAPITGRSRVRATKEGDALPASEKVS